MWGVPKWILQIASGDTWWISIPRGKTAASANKHPMAVVAANELQPWVVDNRWHMITRMLFRDFGRLLLLGCQHRSSNGQDSICVKARSSMTSNVCGPCAMAFTSVRAASSHAPGIGGCRRRRPRFRGNALSPSTSSRRSPASAAARDNSRATARAPGATRRPR